MAQRKKVTGIISHSTLYPNQTANFNGPINVNPVSGSNVVVVDPYSMFYQENDVLKIAVPLTRYYKIKYVLAPYNGFVSLNTAPDNVSSDNAWNINIPCQIMTSSLTIKRYRNGSFYENLSSGVYSSNASVTHHNKWRVGSIASYDSVITCTSGVVEGIVELYAGDELRLFHNTSIYKHTIPYLVRITPITWNGEDYLFLRQPMSSSDSPQWMTYADTNASYGFFFEISEITDL